MSDKSFKVKNGLVVPSLSTAGVVRTDSSGVISSSATLGISEGGTGQTTAQNARNALLPLQTGSEGYFLSTDQTNVSWAKVYNQLFKNAGTSVNPRKNVNIVGAVFSDDAGSDTTTITFTDAVGVSKSGGDTITASGSTVKGLIVKGAASQTANLTEWQDSAGTVYAFINPFGQLSIGQSPTIYSNARISINTVATTVVGQVIRGVASQTANLQEWQNSSGTVLANITGSGGLRVNSAFGGAQAAITAGSAATTGAIIRGAASQTANLQEWQDSAGTVLNRINSAGQIVASSRSVFGGATSIVSGMIIAAVSQEVAATPILARGAASQTADLQQWQNSAGTVITRVRPDGQIGVGSTLITGTNFFVNNTISTTNVVATIRGAASQTADLQQWQDSTGTVKTGITSSGQLYTTQRMTIGLSGISSLGELVVSTTDAARVGVVVQGVASQTANLQEWQNSAGTVLTSVRSDGRLWAGTTTEGFATLQAKTYTAGALAASFEGITSGTSAVVYIKSIGAAESGLLVRGAASQTANLQEWQNNAGTVLSKVDSNGIIYSPTAASGTNTTQVATTEFVSTAVNNLIDSAPGTLNTLNEIAAALNDDPNFSSTITTLNTALSSQDTYSLMGVF